MLSGSCGPGVAGAGAGAGVLVDRPGSVGAWGGGEKAKRLGVGGGCRGWLFFFLWVFFVAVPVPRHPPPSVPPSRVFVFVYSDIGLFK